MTVLKFAISGWVIRFIGRVRAEVLGLLVPQPFG